MLKTIKYIVIILVILFIAFASYGIGRVSKRDQIYGLCMQYHAGLTKDDADFTCRSIMAGDRHAFIEKHD